MTSLWLVMSIIALGWPQSIVAQNNTNNGKWDVIFLVDSSLSMGQANFRSVLRAILTTYIEKWTIGEDNVRVGLIAYSTTLDIISLTGNLAALEQQVPNMFYEARQANTHIALEQADIMLMSSGRSAVNKAVILLTNGNPRLPLNTYTEANKLRTNGVTIYATGLGTQYALIDLLKITGDLSQISVTTNYSSLPLMDLGIPFVQSASPTIDSTPSTQIVPPDVTSTFSNPNTVSMSSYVSSETSSNFVLPSSSVVQTSSNFVQSSSNFVQSSSNFVQSSSSVVQPSISVIQSSSNSVQPSSSFVQSSSSVVQTSSNFVLPSSSVVQPSISVIQSSSNSVQPSSSFVQSSISVVQSSSNFVLPSSSVVQSSSNFVQSSSSVVQTSSNFVQSSSNFVQSSSNFVQSSSSVVQPSISVIQSSSNSVQPSSSFVQSSISVVQSSSNSVLPSSSVVQSTSNFVQSSSSVVQTSSNFVQSSSNFVQSSSNFVQSSSNFVQSSSSVVQPSISVIQSSSNFVQSSSSVVQPSISVIQSSSNFVLPSSSVVQTSSNFVQSSSNFVQFSSNFDQSSSNFVQSSSSVVQFPSSVVQISPSAVQSSSSYTLPPQSSGSIQSSQVSISASPTPTPSPSLSHPPTQLLSSSSFSKPYDPSSRWSSESGQWSVHPTTMYETSSSYVPSPPTPTPDPRRGDDSVSFNDTSLDAGVCIYSEAKRGFGFAPHPYDCDKYFQCHLSDDGHVTASIRYCPRGLFWSQERMTCVTPNGCSNITTCRDPCEYKFNGDTYKMDGGCGLYWECYRGVSIGRNCDPEEAYIPGQGCVYTPGCPYVKISSKSCDDSCEARPLSDLSGYSTELNIGQYKMACLYNTRFDIASCTCKAAHFFHEACPYNTRLEFKSPEILNENVHRNSSSGSNNSTIDQPTECNSICVDHRSRRPLAFSLSYRRPFYSERQQEEVLIRSQECGQGGMFALTEDGLVLKVRIFSKDGLALKSSIPLMGFNGTEWKQVKVQFSRGEVTITVSSGRLTYTVFSKGGPHVQVGVCGWLVGDPGDLSGNVGHYTGEMQEIFISRCFEYGQ